MTIDWWTLGFQTVNVAVLIWLLGHFFWKPVAAMIAARKAAMATLSDEATAAKTKADAALAEVETTRAGFANEREAILAAAHKEAETACAAQLATAQTNAAALEAAAKASIDKAKVAQTSAWGDRSSDLAVAIAAKLAARLQGAVVEAVFLDWLIAEIAKLPKAARAAALAQNVTMEASTATELDATAKDHIVALLGKALGGTPNITFKTDVALIAGIELRSEHLVVESSWRADLQTIRAGLKS